MAEQRIRPHTCLLLPPLKHNFLLLFPCAGSSFQSSRRGGVRAPTTCCQFSALEPAATAIENKAVENLKVKIGGLYLFQILS